MPRVHYGGRSYPRAREESVLEALLRAGLAVGHSCRVGLCQACLMRIAEGAAPAAAQAGLRESLRRRGYFLACVCRPEGDIAVAPAEEAEVWGRAVVGKLRRLAPAIVRVVLEPATGFAYRAGQFVVLRRADGLARSYSLASVPDLDEGLAIDVKRLPGGAMSGWLHEAVRPGEALDIQGPNGECCYSEGRPEQPLLLIATGSALGALLAVVRDALTRGHRGPIRLYHGSSHRDGLYEGPRLAALARAHRNFRFAACVSRGTPPRGVRAGRADQVAFAEHAHLTGWRVFLCGNAEMVTAAKKRAYLAGARLDDIHADPFVLKELRQRPRDAATVLAG